ncbi:MAG: bifunctional riboflavin kinase/FAD synthetase [Alistipes senegalensis]|nr:bifunctional riboflavin kinase/FAD synthetase [Oxalobacter formigenes]MCM1281753.1 bifunctional riboflavin kinase/FAD synthetase [Alistipes senegalensis]
MDIFRGLPSDAPSQPCALAVGNFDGVHRGHMVLLDRVKQAAKRLDISSAVLTFTPHPREYFAIRANRPEDIPPTLTPLRSKLKTLSNAGIGRTTLLRFDNQLANLPADSFIQRILVDGLNAKWLVIGENFRFGYRREGTIDSLLAAGKKFGFEVEIIPAVIDHGRRISSSAIREALKHNDFPLAEQLLGQPYQISGHVIHGDKRGRLLGFPTANLPMRGFNPVLSGVYLTRVYGLASGPLPAVSMIGTRPTVDETPRIVLENHLLDYTQNCYGALIHVEFLQKLRDNRKFSGLPALTEAIRQDIRAARHFFGNPANMAQRPQKKQN